MLEAALFGVVNGEIQSTLRNADGTRDADGALACEELHRLRKAAALLADETVGGDEHVLHDEVGGVGQAYAHLVLVLAHADAGVAFFDQQQAHAVVARIGIGDRQHDAGRAERGVCYKALYAVEHIAAVDLLGCRACAADVGAALRLGYGHGYALSAQNACAGCLLLLLAAVGEYCRQTEGVGIV